jgi:ElaB/YqjD/DUF883 family membrane-anchored ribosome-binding protein
MYNSRIALRLRSRVPQARAGAAIGSHTHQSLYYARTLATTGYSPPPSQPQPQTPRSSPKAGGDSNALYIGGGLAAIGALWYYFSTTEKPQVERREPQPAIDEANRVARDGVQVYQDVKGAAQSKAQGARERASSEIESGKQLYEEGKDEIVNRISEARTAAGKHSKYLDGIRSWLNALRFAEKRVDEAKAGSGNWFSWGKAQTQEAADELKRRANETQDAWNARFEEAKKKAERKGEDIVRRAGETEEDFRRRIAKAIGPGRD